MGPTGNTRIVQIHPTRKCNLSCIHCYSSSSPHETEALDPEVLKQAINDLATEGYEWVTFSGGEPLVYDPLPNLLAHAKRLDLNTTLVSNGMLLTEARMDAIETNINALVISLDGKPESHNTMRNSPRAFQSMQNHLPELRRRGIAFGFLFTLTQHNLDELPWVVDFCLESGARALLVHPLEITGNAKSHLSGNSPDALESAHAWILIERLKKRLAGRLNIQLDLIHTSVLDQQPDLFFLEHNACQDQKRLSDMLSVLVIEPDGEVVPLQYGFPREYSLGNLNVNRISDMVCRWETTVGPEIRILSAELHEKLSVNCSGRFVNWYQLLDQYARTSHVVPLTEFNLPSMISSKAGVA